MAVANDPAPGRGSRKAHPGVVALLAVCAAVVVVWLPRWFDPAVGATSFELWWLNAMPLVLLWVLLFAATRRALTAASVVALIAVVFYTANRLKLQHLELPLMPADLVLVRQVIGNASLYGRYVPFNLLFVLLPIAGVLLWCVEPPVPLRSWWLRGALVLGVSLIFAGVPRGWQPWEYLYSQERLSTSPWMPQQAARQVGAIALFFHLSRSTWRGPAAGDPIVLAEFEQRFGAGRGARMSAAVADQLPDLIILQSESFFDPGRLRGVDSAPYIGNYQRLAQRSLHGELQVPTYGGLTTRTEFELLTGIPMYAMPGVQYPYAGLVYRPLRSLPWALKSLGYTTRAVHPYERRFYDRNRVYPLLGFDSFHSVSEFGERDYHGYHVADAALVRRIIEVLESGAPQLVFAVSIENHGPWDEKRPLPKQELARIEVPESLLPHEAHQLRAFLHHTRRADAALGQLADWVAARERPTLLLFFGDHLPALHEVFDRLGFVDGRPGNVQPLPWLLLDNRREQPRELSLSVHELPSLLLEEADVNRDPYFVASRMLSTDETLPEGERARLLEHLARDSFFSGVELQVRPRSKGRIADVRDWGPRGAEVADATDPMGSKVWVEFDQPPPRGTYLRLGDRRLDVLRVSEHRIYGLISPDGYAGLFRTTGSLALQAVDPLNATVQPIGEIEVRARAARTWLASGQRSRRFCAVEAWGPESSPRDGSANPQPNGLGVWVRAACMPAKARLAFDQTLLDTNVEDRAATASVPLALLAGSDKAQIRLFDAESDEWIVVGELTIGD